MTSNNESIDKQLYDILHPIRFEENFSTLQSFELFLKDQYESPSLLLVQTLRKVLKAYESRELFDQCIILKSIIDQIKEKQKNKTI